MRRLERCRRLRSLAVLSALCLLLASCEVEEELAINADGTGTYRARVAVEKQVGEALQEVRADAEKRGFTVVEEGETADRKFIVVARDFQNVSELNDDEDTYVLDVQRSGPLKAAYHLTLNFRSNPAANGFSRTVQVTLPAAIANASAGTTTGKSVRWDCSHPGTLDVQAAGLVLPFLDAQRKLTVGVLAGLVLALVALRVARRRRPNRCRSCGTALGIGAKFCPKCGTSREAASPRPEAVA